MKNELKAPVDKVYANQRAELFTVLAYDATGNVRVPTPIFVGDEIEWKRDGQAGTLRLKVEQLRVSPTRGTKVYARPLSGGRRLTITKRIFYVFDPAGNRRAPA